MSLAFVVIKNNTRCTVQLGDNYTLGTIDNKCTVFSHQWNFAKVDFLLLDHFDRFIGRFFIVNYKTNLNPQRAQSRLHREVYTPLHQTHVYQDCNQHTEARRYQSSQQLGKSN